MQDTSGIFSRFGAKYGVDGNKVSEILKATTFKVKDGTVSDEQMTALLVVADQFNLNPFTREIYAFPDKQNGIVPVLSVDGWNRIANEHPQYDGVEFRYAEKTVTLEKAKECPEWIECLIYRKDRTRPTIIREYLEECYRKPYTGTGKNGSPYTVEGPWQSHTKRFLRHKAFVQGIRMAMGFAGVYDEDEAQRIAEARVIEAHNTMSPPIDVLPTQPQAALPPAAERFEILINDLGFAEHRKEMDVYLKQCAKQFSTSEEHVKEYVLDRPEDFAKTFPAWVRSAKQRTNGNEKKTPEQTVSKLDVALVTGEVTEDASKNTVLCPNRNDKPIDDWECASCKDRKGCPSWDE